MADMIKFKVKGDRHVGLNFLAKTNGRSIIDLFYAGKYVKTLRIDLTHDMEV